MNPDPEQDAPAQPGISTRFQHLFRLAGAHVLSPGGICLWLASLTLLCYWPVTHAGFINFDDHDYIIDNNHVKAGVTWAGILWALRTGYFCSWHPLTWISHMLDYDLYGLNPGGHHFSNLLFHLTNSLLVFLLLNRLTGAKGRSAFIGALFALHPLHVESVAWVSERKDVLSTFFFLLTLGAYASYAQAKVESPRSKVQSPQPSSIQYPVLYYFLALVLFAFGLMSKPMVVTVPCVLLLVDFWPLKRVSTELFSLRSFKTHIPVLRTLLIEKIPFFLLSAGASLVTFEVQKLGGAVSSLEGIPLWFRVANALVSYSRYLAKTFWPSHLSVFYPYEDHWSLAMVCAAGMLLGVWSIAALLAIRSRPYFIFGWLWFLGTLVPTIGLVQVGSQSMADRYMYIPSIGLFVMVVWGACDVGQALAKPGNRRWLTCAAALTLAACFWVTVTQLAYWQTDEKLFRHALEVTTDNYVAYDHLGDACAASGRREEAVHYYQASLQLRPRYAECRYNLGTALMEMGQLQEAINNLTAAITNAPKFARAYNNLGKTLLLQGHFREAIEQFKTAVKLNPDWPEAHYNLGTALLTDSQPGAINEFSEALRLDPRYGEAHMNFAIACLNLGKTNEALEHFAEAVKLEPDNPEARFNFGLALLERDRRSEAAAQFASGLKLRPDDVRMQSHLAQALARK